MSNEIEPMMGKQNTCFQLRVWASGERQAAVKASHVTVMWHMSAQSVLLRALHTIGHGPMSQNTIWKWMSLKTGETASAGKWDSSMHIRILKSAGKWDPYILSGHLCIHNTFPYEHITHSLITQPQSLYANPISSHNIHWKQTHFHFLWQMWMESKQIERDGQALCRAEAKGSSRKGSTTEAHSQGLQIS